jgi:hypothetical protein
MTDSNLTISTAILNVIIQTSQKAQITRLDLKKKKSKTPQHAGNKELPLNIKTQNGHGGLGHLATWEAEVGRTEALGKPRQIVQETPSPLKK